MSSMSLNEVERLMRLGVELGLSRIKVDGVELEFRARAPQAPASVDLPAGERMPTDDELLFHSAGGLDVMAEPPKDPA